MIFMHFPSANIGERAQKNLLFMFKLSITNKQICSVVASDCFKSACSHALTCYVVNFSTFAKVGEGKIIIFFFVHSMK